MATNSKTKLFLCLKAALQKKALDPVLLDMKGISSVTDYFILLTGKSDRQVQAIARSIEETLEPLGIRPLGQEGVAQGKWILMDYNDVVVHIFLEPIRKFYDLEGIWLDAPRLKVDEEADLG